MHGRAGEDVATKATIYRVSQRSSVLHRTVSIFCSCSRVKAHSEIERVAGLRLFVSDKPTALGSLFSNRDKNSGTLGP